MKNIPDWKKSCQFSLEEKVVAVVMLIAPFVLDRVRLEPVFVLKKRYQLVAWKADVEEAMAGWSAKGELLRSDTSRWKWILKNEYCRRMGPI